MNFMPPVPPSALPGISPSRGEIGAGQVARLPAKVAERYGPKIPNLRSAVWQVGCKDPISPLEGEMPGRAEGGAKPRKHFGEHTSC